MKYLLHSQAVIVSLLVLSIFAAYWTMRENGFVRYDDTTYILSNPHVLSGLTIENIRWAFTTFDAGNYHPLTWLSHLLDVSLFGVNPGAHHIINLVLHVLTAILLFVFFRSLCGNSWLSVAVAALWALHPLRVESVAWAAERKDLLCGLFWLATLVIYKEYQNSRLRGGYWAALSCFALGLLSKPMMVTLPVILVLLDFWHYQKVPPIGTNATPNVDSVPILSWKRLIVEKIPFFILAFGFSVITFHAQKSASAVMSLQQLPFVIRIENASVSYMLYIFKMIWPSGLTLFYPYPAFTSLLQIILCALGLIAISAMAIRYFAKMPWLTVGWLWYVITLLPVIGVFQVGEQAYADRYTYIPSIGIYVILLFALARINFSKRAIMVPVIVVVSGTAILFAILTGGQIRYWKNSLTLFNRSILVTRDNYLAHGNLGIALIDHGRYSEAMVHLKEAIRIRPEFMDAMNNIGVAFTKMGEPDSAIKYYAEVVRRRPASLLAWGNLGSIYQSIDSINRAIVAYEHARSLDRTDYSLCNNLGVCYAYQGNNGKAAEVFTSCLMLRPDGTEARLNRARVYFKMGRKSDAAGDLKILMSNHSGDARLHSVVDSLLKQNYASLVH